MKKEESKLTETEFPAALPGTRDFPWWRTQLPAYLERQFISEIAPRRRTQFRFWACFNLVISILVLGLDAISSPDVWWEAVVLRLGILLPIGILALYLLQRPRKLWVEELATAGPRYLGTIGAVVLFGLSETFDVVRAYAVPAATIVLGNVLFPVRLPQAMAFSLFTVAVSDAINIGVMRMRGLDMTHLDLIILSHAAIILSLLARGVAEREARLSFIHGLHLQMRAENLTRTNEHLAELASTDPLTGLANRRHFDQELEKAWRIAGESQFEIAVMMIDVDYFKLFNDKAGHLEGDRCLVKVAQIIAEQVRNERDIVARYGGEEFVVLMPMTQLKTAAIIAERVRKTIMERNILHPGRPDRGTAVSVSIGVAAALPGANNVLPEPLLAAADAGLYSAKAAGRNRIVCANAELAAGRP